MSNNLSLAGSAHLRALLDSALESSSGIRVKGLSLSKAKQLRQQLHSLRTLERRKSAKAFPLDDPRSGTSAYDALLTEIITEGNLLFSLRIYSSASQALALSIIDEATGEEVKLGDLLC